MLSLSLGLILFLGVHCLALFPKYRQSLRDKYGLNRYKGIYSLLSLFGFILIVYGKSNAEFVHVWAALPNLRHVTYLLVWIGLILLVSAHLKGHLRAMLGHPMMLGTLIWAIAHLLVNGDLASLMLFGGFGLFSLVYLVFQKFSRSQPTSFNPKLSYDALALVVGTLVFGLVFRFHGTLFSVPLIS
ncbi:hypothetical protein DBZ36_14255 [Alginatibacterium sediminis]|uniref:NnrU domain-containing protein n=1 Tax=Alginatibacterium sediminis TaxID=2164068 RepID=A0A420E8A8_9ALTE|nr:NnrU family protein [Alginatibacterium sediminis]RKF15548.1 hypothetical protein DBZ36_14255 [Alginatibacterium sediminis]